MSCYFMSQITYEGVLFILLFNVLDSFNFEVMDVRRSFPYFSTVEFHVVYFFGKTMDFDRNRLMDNEID